MGSPPAGLERTMIADLTGKIPAGTRRIRIVNNLKIYWDAIRIDQTLEQRSVRVTEVLLANASLDFLGFPRKFALIPCQRHMKYSYAKLSMNRDRMPRAVRELYALRRC